MTNLEEVAPEDEPRAYRSKRYLPEGARRVGRFGDALHARDPVDVRRARGRRRPLRTHRSPRRSASSSRFARRPSRAASRATSSSRSTASRSTSGTTCGRALIEPRRRDGRRSPCERDGVDELPVTVATVDNPELDPSVAGSAEAIGRAGSRARRCTSPPSAPASSRLAPAPRQVGASGATSLGALGEHVLAVGHLRNYFRPARRRRERRRDRQQRFLSPVGFGAGRGRRGRRRAGSTSFGLLIAINVFVGLVQPVPLLPFDGGHIAIATYEKIASTITPPAGAGRRRQAAAGHRSSCWRCSRSSSCRALFLDITSPVDNPF